MNLATVPSTATLYDTDFYGWIRCQLAALRTGRLADLDMENLIEEVESMGKSEKRELESRIELLLMHLLKWAYQPERRGASWEATVKAQRRRLAQHLQENPSLKSLVPDIYKKTYGYAVLDAVRETGMAESVFPATCPWTFDEATDADFWPQVG